nr:hypothetical protein [uncultured Methanolobus sp.]
MGFVKAFVVLLIGLPTILLAYATFSPVLDFLIAFCMALGGGAAFVANIVRIAVYRVVPVLLILAYLVYAFLESTRSEDNSRWR